MLDGSGRMHGLLGQAFTDAPLLIAARWKKYAPWTWQDDPYSRWIVQAALNAVMETTQAGRTARSTAAMRDLESCAMDVVRYI